MGEDDARRAAPGRLPRNTRPRDELGRPLPYGSPGAAHPAPGLADTASQALDEAQRLLDSGLPFHAHEVLEEAWKSAPATERDLWQGLAQLAVGATHAARGNATGAISLLRRGAGLITPYAAAAPHGLDIVELVRWADEAIRQVTREVPVALTPPRLRTPISG